jgi:hypothetical protein
MPHQITSHTEFFDYEHAAYVRKDYDSWNQGAAGKFDVEPSLKLKHLHLPLRKNDFLEKWAFLKPDEPAATCF